MGKKDTQLKWYLGKDRIFADFCNGALTDLQIRRQLYREYGME